MESTLEVYIRAKGDHVTGAFPGFCSMKRLGVFLLPTRWDAGLLQGYPPPQPQYQIPRFLSIHLDEERYCERKVSWPRTQHNVRARARTRTARSANERTNRETTAPATLSKFKPVYFSPSSFQRNRKKQNTQTRTVWRCPRILIRPENDIRP